jgi:hypothetical protein
MISQPGRSIRRPTKKKNEPVARYICGLPDCRAIVELPRRSLTASWRHRDKHGFRCDGLLVLLELTPEGKRAHIDALFQKYMRKKYREQTGHD